MNWSLVSTGWRSGSCKPSEGDILQVYGMIEGRRLWQDPFHCQKSDKETFPSLTGCHTLSAQVLMPYLDCKCTCIAKGPCWLRCQAAFIIPAHFYEEITILWFLFRAYERWFLVCGVPIANSNSLNSQYTQGVDPEARPWRATDYKDIVNVGANSPLL